jgi:MFS family permease
MPLIGGYLVDRVGFRKMTVATTVLAGVGHLGFTISAAYKFWGGMWASRAVFGIGTESLCVAQRILVAEWFIGKELALAMGIVLAFGRLGSTVNDNISALFEYCVSAYWVGFALCCLSILSAMVVTWIDARHEATVENAVSPTQWTAYLRSRTLRPKTKLSDICRMGLGFWLCCGMVLFCFPPVSSFNNISSQLVATRWMDSGHPQTQQSVNAIVGILYAVSAALALVMGWVVDKAGTRTLFVLGGAIIVGVTHILIAAKALPIAPLLVFIGIGFSSLAAAVWPEIAFVAPRECFGIAYGLAGAVQNTGLASVPAIVATLQPPACNGDYHCVEDLFAGISFTGAGFAAIAAVAECFRRRQGRPFKEAPAELSKPLLDVEERKDSFSEAAEAGGASRPWTARRKSSVSIQCGSEHAVLYTRGSSFGEFISATEHQRRGETPGSEDGDRAHAPPAPVALSTAVWEYAAEVALHGESVASRHYRPRQTSTLDIIPES